jgi:hypothetical protein
VLWVLQKRFQLWQKSPYVSIDFIPRFGSVTLPSEASGCYFSSDAFKLVFSAGVKSS